jgi:hypothetical protein
MHWLKFIPSSGQYNGTDCRGRNVCNFDGDDGDSPPPQPTQTSQLTIPEYAKPYMETLLGKAEALTSTGYQPYGGERISQMDPLQQQAYMQSSQMQAPDFSFATGLAGSAGLAGLQAGQYQPSQFGYQQVNAPTLQQYGMTSAQGAYDQMAIPDTFGQAQAQQYMSPYFQNVLDVQKQSALRDAQKSQLLGNLASARQGTYGGARNVLAGTERERALLGQMSEIQAKGLQSAYENAQAQFERDRAAQMQAGTTNLNARMQMSMANLSNEQQARVQNLASQLQTQGLSAENAMRAALANQGQAMEAQRATEQSRQFGGNLGMQGLQAALQGATTMGQLGATEQQAGIDLTKFQSQMGAEQRQQQQAALDLAYQDFINQQQYPYKQLGFMSDLLRGSADLAGKGGTTVYQAQPSPVAQAAGLGLQGLALSKLLG